MGKSRVLYKVKQSVKFYNHVNKKITANIH